MAAVIADAVLLYHSAVYSIQPPSLRRYICIWRVSNVFTSRFFFRFNEMAEALTNSFQNLYNKYTRSENTENAALNNREIYIVPVTANNIGGTDDSQLLQRFRSKSRRAFSFDTKQLCQSKESKWHILKPKSMRPYSGQCCSVCIPVRLRKCFKFHFILKIYNMYSPTWQSSTTIMMYNHYLNIL